MTKRAPMTWSNCVIYAVRQWWRHGGYVIVCRSSYGWWPHVFWSADLGTFCEFVPQQRRTRRLPPPLFCGHVREYTFTQVVHTQRRRRGAIYHDYPLRRRSS